MRRMPKPSNRRAIRNKLGFKDGDFVLCSFGIVGPIKLTHRLVQAWLQSKLAHQSNCHLVLVGGESDPAYGGDLRQAVAGSQAKGCIHITGYVTPEVFQQYLSAADAAAQLRTLSRGETSGAVLDCMAHKLPIIVNGHGSSGELPKNCVFMLPDEFSDAELVSAIEQLYEDEERRNTLGRKAQSYVKTELSPRMIADQYFSAIERHSTSGHNALTERAAAALSAIESKEESAGSWLALARAISRNAQSTTPERQLLVDVSELVHHDARTGIQRVTRSILAEMLFNPPFGYRVEPVYAVTGKPGFQYARKFTMRLFECPEILPDAPVEPKNGDIFLGLDLQPHIVPGQIEFFLDMRRVGSTIHFVAYDMLLLQLPHAFVDGASDLLNRWLLTISACADGIIGISRATADGILDWLDINGPRRIRPIKVGWFHLGADIERSLPSQGLPDNGDAIIAKSRRSPQLPDGRHP